MKNNEPEILGYCAKRDRKPWERSNTYYLSPTPDKNYTVPVIRLTDYEELQAECERWKRGSEIRDEQNQDLHSFIMELKAECEKLVEALERISKRASEAECHQVPCSPIQRLFVDIMQQADDALSARRKQGGEV